MTHRVTDQNQSINGMLYAWWHNLINEGLRSAPRGLPIREFIGTSFTIMKPRERICTLPGRKFSLAYAAGELAWYLGGHEDLEFIRYYAPRYERFSDDGHTLYGAYGPRIFTERFDDGDGRDDRSMWQRCLSLLQEDPDTRQAVIPIMRPWDVARKTKDYPCTVALQFLIREKRLHLITTMRSNDAWLGTPNDVFCFTVLQELMARQLNVDLGHYVHQAGSLHLYERDLDKAEEVVREAGWNNPEQEWKVGPGFIHGLLSAEKAARAMDAASALEALGNAMGELNRGDLLTLVTVAWLWKRLKVLGTAKTADVTIVGQLLEERLGCVFRETF